MYSVKDISEFLDISIVSLHRWSKEHQKYLDPAANDPEGSGRQYTEDDVTVLWTIKSLRDENQSHDDIRARLTNGYRVEPPYMPEDIPQTLIKPRTETAQLRQIIAERDALVAELNKKLETTEKENENLRGQIEALNGVIDRLLKSKE